MKLINGYLQKTTTIEITEKNAKIPLNSTIHNKSTLVENSAIGSTTSLLTTQPTTQLPQQQALNQTPIQPNAPLSARLNTGPFMSTSVKLLDENLTWQESLQEVRTLDT